MQIQNFDNRSRDLKDKVNLTEVIYIEPMAVSFEVLLGYLHRVITQVKDTRQVSNGQLYSLRDVLLGAFSVFFMQCESFLEHQRQMQSRQGKDNAQTLFGLGQIPTMLQIRNMAQK